MNETSEESAPATPIPPELEGIVVVLWETQDHVNIAGTVRAMKNFGLTRLRLVNPALWDPWRIEGIAHDTKEIVERAEIFSTLDEALADCSFVAGMTARSRRVKRAITRPRELAGEVLGRAAEAAAAEAGPVALLFGREDKGLSNEALDRCHRTCIIPTNPEHSSLNLAQAVLVILYELWIEAAGKEQTFKPPRRDAPPPTAALLEVLFADMERSLWAIDFFKTRQPDRVMRTLRELVRRADTDAREAGLLRAISLEVVKYLKRKGVLELPPEAAARADDADSADLDGAPTVGERTGRS